MADHDIADLISLISHADEGDVLTPAQMSHAIAILARVLRAPDAAEALAAGVLTKEEKKTLRATA